MFEVIKDYYSRGWWTKKKVANAVVAGWLSSDDYKSITSDNYLEDSQN